MQVTACFSSLFPLFSPELDSVAYMYHVSLAIHSLKDIWIVSSFDYYIKLLRTFTYEVLHENKYTLAYTQVCNFWIIW